MRIAYVTADFGIPVFGDKGASIHIQEMVKAFANLGHEVTLFATRLGTPPDSFPAKLHKSVSAPAAVSPETADAAGGERLFKERRYLELGHTTQRDIEREHRIKPFDFIYERYSLWSAAGVRAGRNLTIPCILEMNAPLLLEQARYRQLVLAGEAEDIEREVLGRADLINAVSAQVRNYAIAKGAHPAVVDIQPNGVDPTLFSVAGEVADIGGGAGPVIGFSGSLKPWHGLEDLLEAFSILKAGGSDCRLLIVGDGPMRGWIEGYGRGARIADRVILTGWKPYGELPAYIRRMDVAVAPYPEMQDFYFSPLKLFEYLACGRAIVASEIGQIAQTIVHGRNGLLCRPSDPAHLAQCIAKLAADATERRRLGEAARTSMTGKTWEDAALRVLESVAGLTALVRRHAAR